MTVAAEAERAPARRRHTTAALCAFAAALSLAAIDIGFALGATREEQWLLAARYTARLSFPLFVTVFLSTPWNQLAPSAASRFVAKRRRSFGLAFATAHTIHLGALATYLQVVGEHPAPQRLAVGGAAYLGMFLMVATSTDGAVRRLGRHWRTLHRVGLYLLWFVFAFTYSNRVATRGAAYLPQLMLVFAALGVRIAAWRRRRARLRG
jgi:methionine sulfoxide reductase heme-binding subunit